LKDQQSMATIRDVAKQAGVSTATVSHVINGTRVVMPETRQAVLMAIEQLNYRPSAVARGLTTNSTRTVGVVIANVTSPFFAFLLRDIEALLSVQGYNLLVCNTYEEPEREARNLEDLLDRRVDGVILTPTGYEQPIYTQFNALNIPLVFIDRNPPNVRGAFIGTDNDKAAYEATRCLIDLGHRRIGLISLLPETSAVNARIAGYQRALQEAGIVHNPDLVQATTFDADNAAEVTRAFFDLESPPTALIAGSHPATIGALAALRAMDLHYPEDVSLIAFDNSEWTGVIRPSLTVVTKPILTIAQAAVKTLLKSMGEVDRQKKNHLPVEHPPAFEILLEAQLIFRESCRQIVNR
jgi:LacI family transcriptional regulator